MKPNIHPTYYKDAVIKCACGASYLVGSTDKELSVEICSSCHPFYTGKQKLVDTAGRVDKFKARVEAASKAKVKKDAPKVDTASAESGAGAPASKGMRGGTEKETPAKAELKHKGLMKDTASLPDKVSAGAGVPASAKSRMRDDKKFDK